MKEDILEQIVEDYLHSLGYFTLHNVKFRPDHKHKDYNSTLDSSYSDIDVLGFHPKLRGTRRVYAVSCKSWERGFAPAKWLKLIKDDEIIHGRKAWQSFRELCVAKWGASFVDRIYDLTGSEKFTHVTAVTKLIGNSFDWENYSLFSKNIKDNDIKLLTLKTMLDQIQPNLTKTPEPSQVGRLLQVIKASGWAAGDTPAKLVHSRLYPSHE